MLLEATDTGISRTGAYNTMHSVWFLFSVSRRIKKPMVRNLYYGSWPGPRHFIETWCGIFQSESGSVRVPLHTGIQILNIFLLTSPMYRVSDPHWFNADPDTDPDPAFFLIADPDPDQEFDDLKWNPAHVDLSLSPSLLSAPGPYS